jgi:hypothetical protein
MLRRICFLLTAALLLQVQPLHAQSASQPAASAWKAKVAQAMPLLGHRNWILIVDSAYPLQASPGIETIETNAGLLEVTQQVLATIGKAPHVRPDIFMDAELPFVPDADVPGASAYRAQIAKLLHNYKIESMPHDKVIANIDQSSKTFKVLVLKTNMTIPYSSVFLRLNCRYWSDEAEARMRAKMAAQPK